MARTEVDLMGDDTVGWNEPIRSTPLADMRAVMDMSRDVSHPHFFGPLGRYSSEARRWLSFYAARRGITVDDLAGEAIRNLAAADD